MVKRIVSSLLLLPILLGVIVLRGAVLDMSVALISCIALFELFRAFENKGIKPMFILSILTTLMIYGGIYFNMMPIYYLFIVSLFALILMMLNLFGKSEGIQDIAFTALGFIYVVVPFAHISMVSHLDSPVVSIGSFQFSFLLVYVFILAWVSDTFAYFFGVTFGKHKLLPSVSPKKSVEGFVAGIVGTAIISGLLAYMAQPDFLVYAVLLGLFGSIAGTIGDLIASKIKREMDIKDYGKLIPGHGGILDRFDSIMLTAPIVYYIGYLYLQIK